MATRQPASAARHANLCLADLAARAGAFCQRSAAAAAGGGRAEGGGRLEVASGQLRNLQGVLRDYEWTLHVLCDALLELGGTQVAPCPLARR